MNLKHQNVMNFHIKKINITSEYLDIVKQGMYDVVNVPGGTAYRSHFNINGMEMAGKTGSTQVRRITMKERQTRVLRQDELPWKFRDHALFIAFAPYDNPKYSIVIINPNISYNNNVIIDNANRPIISLLILFSFIPHPEKYQDSAPS